VPAPAPAPAEEPAFFIDSIIAALEARNDTSLLLELIEVRRRQGLPCLPTH
jgi:hypothetical protein